MATLEKAVAAPAPAAGATLVMVDEDEIYEEPLPYPKMGNGLVLPPEEEDLHLLVDEDVASWSHSWQEAGVWMGAMAGHRVEGLKGMELQLGLMGSGGVAVGVGA